MDMWKMHREEEDLKEIFMAIVDTMHPKQYLCGCFITYFVLYFLFLSCNCCNWSLFLELWYQIIKIQWFFPSNWSYANKTWLDDLYTFVIMFKKICFQILNTTIILQGQHSYLKSSWILQKKYLITIIPYQSRSS